MQSTPHIDDDVLSALVDQELGPQDLARASTHLDTCSDCHERLDGLRSVAVLLRQLPDIDPPRDLTLGPRLLADPPNVVRLRRWYTAARASAAALAAVCVFLLAGTLYLDAKPAPPASRPVSLAAPAAAPAASTSTSTSTSTSAPAVPTTVPPQAAVPAQARTAAGDDAATHPTAINPEADDQVAAATSVSPLPTPPPTPVPTVVPAPVAAVVATAESGPGAPLGFGALAAGALAIVALLIALVARHRLQRASSS